MSMADCPEYTVVAPAWPTDPPAVWCDPRVCMTAADVPDTSENCALALMAVQDATWILDSLTGHQFHGAEQWREEYVMFDPCRVKLWKGPVSQVISVTEIDDCKTGSTPTAKDWCMVGASTINVCPGACVGFGWMSNGWSDYIDFPWYWGTACGCDRPHLIIDYDTKSTLPPGAAMAACKLASERLKSVLGKPCQLPERVNTVTRQGVSWTVLDSQEFLTHGLTGVSQVDAFISTARYARPNTHIVDPLYGRLVRSQLLGIVGAPTPGPSGVPNRYDITMYQGDDFEMTVKFNTDEGAPIDITTWVFRAQIRTDIADIDPTEETEFTCVVDPINNNVLIMSLASETTTLLSGHYVYDLQSDDQGNVTTWLSGNVTVLPEVSRIP